MTTQRQLDRKAFRSVATRRRLFNGQMSTVNFP
jgi:hypothetical protein